jgi:hypothetical protein
VPVLEGRAGLFGVVVGGITLVALAAIRHLESRHAS